MKKYSYFLFVVLSVVIITAQGWGQASSYFPQQIGYRWLYKVASLWVGDTVIPGSEVTQMDSFAATEVVDGKVASRIESRTEFGEEFYISHYSFENANAYWYFSGIPSPLDEFVNLPQQWLLAFKFQSGTVPPWTIFQYDTTLTFDTLTIPLRVKLTGSRVSLTSNVVVPAGTFVAAKFLITSQVGTYLGPIFLPFITLVDTFWIADNVWIVKHYRSTTEITFDTLSFVIPGMSRSLLSSGILTVDDKDEVPKTFLLEQNYPNPFNPETVIRYQLPVDSWVTLKVYDILGKEVEALANEFQVAGFKSVSFDGSNLPSGVYVYRLTAGSFSDVKKLLLLK